MVWMVIALNIEGTVEKITYRDEESLFTVAKIRQANGPLVTAVGLFPFVSVGQNVEATGDWITHKDYGRQFRVVDVKITTPDSVVGLEKYLASGLIDGIGPVFAKKLVEKFGSDTLKVIENHPERLLEIEGIGEKKAEKIVKAIDDHKAVSKVMVFLQGHGVSPAYAVKIYKAYGDDSVNVVSSNPYKLADEIFGIGFKTADRIASNIGIIGNSPNRIDAGVKYMLSLKSGEGHCYLPFDDIVEQTCQELEVGRDDVVSALERLAMTNEVCIEDDGLLGSKTVYLSQYYYSEKGVAYRLVQLNAARMWEMEGLSAEEFEKVQESANMKLGDRQREAVFAAFNSGVFVLTGGPGTGKTTTLRMIIDIFEARGKKVCLAAPTGRAAKRLSQAARREAKTIHRLLEFEPGQDGWKFGRGQENCLKCDVVIVDEMSMVDISLMYSFVKAIKPGCRLIMVGDVDQLPSVGPGNVLRDIINSGVIKTVVLDEVFRQKNTSQIVLNAHRINAGQFPYIPEKPRDFFFINEEDPEMVAERIKYLVTTLIPGKFKLDPVDDVQVLSPMRRTVTGVDNLNTCLREALNPSRPRCSELKFGNYRFRLSDKVMQVRNDYDKSVWNGDMGRIIKIDTENGELVVRFPEGYGDKDVVYEQRELDELTLSYCVSIHKSQGSEYPAVVIPVTTQHYIMLQRNLIYTGVTRAKRAVVLVGTKKALAMAIRNKTVGTRMTKLARRITDENSKLDVDVEVLKETCNYNTDGDPSHSLKN